LLIDYPSIHTPQTSPFIPACCCWNKK